MIALCLLTCDRYAYTRRTLETWAAMNDASRFTLLHGDDASSDGRVPDLARAYGFKTVVAQTRRRGWLVTRTALFEQAAKRKAAWVLFLENDIEWARPFPWALFDYLRKRSSVSCLRLYGAFKDRARRDPCLPFHKQSREQPVKWKPIKFAPERAEVGRIHWSAQPSVTRTQDLLDLHHYGMESPDLTARVVENVTYHIGAERTDACVSQ